MFAFDYKNVESQNHPGPNILGFIYSCATEFLQTWKDM